MREGWETCEQAESQFRHIVPNNSYYPKWLDVRVSHAEQHRENNNKVIPETPIASKKRGEKHNKYILATHGPLSRFAVRIGYIPSQKYVKHYAPSGSKFLRTPGTPLALT